MIQKQKESTELCYQVTQQVSDKNLAKRTIEKLRKAKKNINLTDFFSNFFFHFKTCWGAQNYKSLGKIGVSRPYLRQCSSHF